ncbi:hypothetical protein [Wenyingzhuangia sp. IMCC45574]
MKKGIRALALSIYCVFVSSCSSDDSLSNGISIDPNNISIETLNGTWEMLTNIDIQGVERTVGEGWDVLDDEVCPEKPSERYTYIEDLIAVENGEMFLKKHFKDEVYRYDASASRCDLAGQSLEITSEYIRYEAEEVTKLFVSGNKLYLEVKEGGSETGYDHYRITFEENRIVFSLIFHLGKQDSEEDLKGLNYRDIGIYKKVSNDVDLSNFNDGKEFYDLIQ